MKTQANTLEVGFTYEIAQSVYTVTNYGVSSGKVLFITVNDPNGATVTFENQKEVKSFFQMNNITNVK